MSMSVGDSGGDAMCEMNTTPLIDVMLVLLIMFILNIPVQTHATKVNMPPITPPPPPPIDQPPPVIHKLEIDFLGNSLWDGAIVDEATLQSKLERVGAPKDAAEQDQVNLRPDQFAKYDAVLKVMAMAQRNQVQNLAFVGNEAYANQ
jgi:biopolymer transport protein ExbD